MTSPAGPHIEGMSWLEVLGSGGYSDVHLYQRTSPRMKVAVKILKNDRLTDSERAQFAAEAETMAELADHPYIVQVFSTGALDDGRPFLVMKQYPPRNLAVRARDDRMSVADVLRNGVKIASAVETAHRAGIMHRDIKPANVLISQYGEPGLTDFGIAGHAEHDDSDDVGVSIPWAAPEVLTGTSNGDVRSDVYSLGATVWHLLAGRSPFDVPGDNGQRALINRVVRSAVPSTGRADVPASLERLLSQTMAKNPAVRPRTALEFARGLQAIEQEQRFGRTDIVVEGLGAARDSSTDWARPARPGESQTRMRAPARVVAQPQRSDVRSAFAPPATGTTSTRNPSGPASSAGRQPRSATESTVAPMGPGAVVDSAPPAFVTPSDPARERLAPPSAGADPTMRRATTPTSPTDEPPTVLPRRGVRKGFVGIVAAAAVVVAIAVGIVLSSSGSGGRPQSDSTPTDVASQNLQLPGVGAPTPTVSATYDSSAHVVRFAWRADGMPAGALYGTYRDPADASSPTRTSATASSVPAAGKPSTVCLYVVVIVPGEAPSSPSMACG